MYMRLAVAVWLLLPVAMRVWSQTAPVSIQPPRRDVFDAALVPDSCPEARQPLRVVLLADEKDHGPAGNGLHDYPLWQERWALLLGGRAASDATQINLHGPAVLDASMEDGAPGVTVECASGWPTDEHFAQANVIAAFNYLAWTDARKKQVAEYLGRGGGLVLIHSATWTKPKADQEVADLVGIGGFMRYRHGAVKARIVSTGHPVCRNLPAALCWDDETYWPPLFPMALKQVTVLAVSDEDGNGDTARQPQPVFWTYESGRGRVFGCVPGHRAGTFDDPWFRLAVLRGIAWAAGGSPYRFDRLAPRGARFDGPVKR